MIYVAAEGSATILNRVVAYRTYHDVESFPLGIVTTGVNLLDPAADTDRLIALIIEKAKEIKAKADAEALAIRNRAYSKDPDFADYWMALEEYKTILPKFNKTMTTDSDFYKYLYNKRGR